MTSPRNKVYLVEVKTTHFVERLIGQDPTPYPACTVVTADLYTMRNGKRTKRPVWSCTRGGIGAEHRAIMGVINGYVGQGGFACTSQEKDGTKKYQVRERNGITYEVHKLLNPETHEEEEKASQRA